MDRRTPLDLTLPCRLWPGALDEAGYGVVMIDGKQRRVHRVAFQLYVGGLGGGLQVDHACHNLALERGECAPGICDHRRCYEPGHLERVTSFQNSLRGGHAKFVAYRNGECTRGHDMTDPTNWAVDSRTGRIRCRICGLENQRKYRERKKASR